MDRRKLPLGLLVAFAIQISNAAFADAGLWYAGLGVGQSSLDVSGNDVDAAYGGITSTSVDDEDLRWQKADG